LGFNVAERNAPAALISQKTKTNASKTVIMKSLIISTTNQASGVLMTTKEEVRPVENEEIFDHLFVHNDRKFARIIFQQQ
jgi:hypothetical protein